MRKLIPYVVFVHVLTPLTKDVPNNTKSVSKSSPKAILGQVALITSFIISEIMPFVNNIESNGLLHGILQKNTSALKPEIDQ